MRLDLITLGLKSHHLPLNVGIQVPNCHGFAILMVRLVETVGSELLCPLCGKGFTKEVLWFVVVGPRGAHLLLVVVGQWCSSMYLFLVVAYLLCSKKTCWISLNRQRLVAHDEKKRRKLEKEEGSF